MLQRYGSGNPPHCDQSPPTLGVRKLHQSGDRLQGMFEIAYQPAYFPTTMLGNAGLLSKHHIMAKKSKGFRDLLKQERQATDHSQKALDGLAKKVQKGSLGHHVKGIVQNPRGQVKMSEVLEDFVEPYLEEIEGYVAKDRFISVAVLAWNLAIMPEEARQTAKEQLQNQLEQGELSGDQELWDSLLDELVERKFQYFADNRRLIMEFQFEDTGDQYHLSVASMQAPPRES